MFARQRDVSLVRHLNREVMGNVITQQAAFYQFKLEETKVNIYGESAGAKYYYTPVILSCLIDHQPQEYPDDEFGVQYNRNVNFKHVDKLIDI